MATYFLRRLLLLIPTLLGVTLVVFAVTRFVPGGPVEQIIMRMQGGSESKSGSQRGGGQSLSEEQMTELKEFYGLNDPTLVAYSKWLGKVVQLDFGTSTRYQEDVWELMKPRIGTSMSYALIVLILQFALCIPLGLFKAIRHKTFIDSFTSILVFVGYSIPGYVMGILFAMLFSVKLGWFPLGGFVSENFSELTLIEKVKDFLWHAALPIAAYLAGAFAYITQLMKNSLLDNLAADYVRTAIAKGIPFKRAVFKHALRNSLIPICTYTGMSIVVLVGGSFLVETIFNIDGIGLFGYEALLQRDYPIVLAVLTIDALALLFGNMLADFLVALADPRVQFG